MSVLILTAVTALALRIWHWDRIEISEFDQGVYSASAQAVSRFERPYPGVQFQAPPGYYGAGALLTRATGMPGHRSLLLISLLAGVGTVLLAGIAGSIWFGARAGALAATILAVSDFHIRFSREALTDTTFSFCFLLALFTGWRALTSGTLPATLLAGCAAGAAWETKVNGWFAVVVLALATLVDYIRTGEAQTLRSRLRNLGIIGVLAGILYLPALLLIVFGGGLRSYAGVMRGYLSHDYFQTIARYWEILAGWDGAVRGAFILVAILAALWASGSVRLPARVAILAAVLSAATLPFGLSRTLFAVAPMTACVLWRSAGLGGPIVLSSLIVWMASAPFYTAAERLLLPLFVTAALAVGALFGQLWLEKRSTGSGWPSVSVLAIFVLLGVTFSHFGWTPLWSVSRSSPWQSYDFAALGARRIVAELPRDARVLIADSPPVAYYLMAAGVPVSIVRQRIMAAPTKPVWLVTAGAGLDVSTYHGSLAAPLLPLATRLWTIGEGRRAVTLYRVDPQGKRPSKPCGKPSRLPRSHPTEPRGGDQRFARRLTTSKPWRCLVGEPDEHGMTH